MLTVRLCPNTSCGLVERHPIRWCTNCGSEFKIVQMESSEVERRLVDFMKRTKRDPEFNTRFDPDTGEPWSNSKKESI